MRHHSRPSRSSRFQLHSARAFASALALIAFSAAIPRGSVSASAVWTRLELVENSAEGPPYDRCAVEATLEKGQAARWRIFFGEARPDAGTGWSAIRPSSGCALAGADPAASLWSLRGSPYFTVDVTVGQPSLSGGETLLEAALSFRTLTGFTQDGAPAYELRTEKRTLRVPDGGSAAIPVLVASPRELDEFGVRELFLKFRASAPSSRPKVEYGTIAVAADIPRAEIFLDGGLVGRTSADGPVVLGAVRVGEREIVVRDASGREARAVAKVEEGGRANLSLTLLKGAPPASDGLRPLGRNPQGAEEFWREKDSAIVVRIPGGEYQMGSADTEGEPSEHPRHAVRVDGFLIDKVEVTWGQYKLFQTATSQPPPKTPIWGMPEAFPASGITWEEARAFCEWAGGRLPTEAEWERAARGDESQPYPWGSNFDPWRCNTRDGGPHAPTPAAAYPDCVSPYGVLDLAGSVSEWCSDWFDETYYAKSPAGNPKGPETGTRRAVRGGAWMTSSFGVRIASRLGVEPAWSGPMQGFRCVQDDRRTDPR